MINSFYYNPVEECKADYLTRMAKVIDSIRNGVELPEFGFSLRELLSEEEKREVADYVFGIMMPTIKEEGCYYIRKNGMKAMADDYLNQLYLEVWKNFHKYNNPSYKETEGTCSFRTFVKIYTKDPARTVTNNENGVSKRAGYKKNIIKKTQRYITSNYGIDVDDITAEDIFANMKEVSATQLSVNDIAKTMSLMMSRAGMEDIENNCDYATEMEELYIASQNVTDTFHAFVNKLRPMQRFIFCQNFGFCSEKYDDITLAQLACDADFLKLVKEDVIGKKHLVTSDVQIDAPRKNGSVIQGGPIVLCNVEHIDVNFITHQRVRCRDLIVEFVKEKGLDEYDVMSSLTQILGETWDELSTQYGLR